MAITLDKISAACASVKISDGTNDLAINADGSINANVIMDNVSTWQNSSASASATAAELAPYPLSGRDSMIIQNKGPDSIFVGPANTVTNANGLEIPACSSMKLNFEEGANVWAVTATGGSASLIVSEFAA